MPINPQRVKLDSELADLDQQLQAVDRSTCLSSGQKVIRKGCLQHRRSKKYLEVEILELEALVEGRKRGVEEARKSCEWAKTPDGLRVLLKAERRRGAGMALDGGTNRKYTAFDMLTPEQRVIRIAESKLTQARHTLSDAQARLSETTRQLRELQAKDSEWEALAAERSVVIADVMPPRPEATAREAQARTAPDSPTGSAITGQQAAARSHGWEDIDHSLANLKLADLAAEFHKQIHADEMRIQFENRHNLNTNAPPSLVLSMKEQRTDEWAHRAYQVYCDVWQTQGRLKSASFVRAVYERGIVPLIQARAGAIASEFESFAQRTAFPKELCKAHLKGFQLRMLRFQDRWRRRLEIEAKECEHAERTGNLNVLAAGKPPSIEHRSTHLNPAGEVTETLREAIIKKVQNPQTYTLLSVFEATIFFEVQPRTIYRWIDERKLKNGGKRGSITIQSILEWQKKRSRKHPKLLR